MRINRLRRREFITLVGGAAAAWPAVVQAQQKERVRRIGILMPFPKSDAAFQARVRVFRQELARLGWSEGRNVQFDERWSTDNMDVVRLFLLLFARKLEITPFRRALAHRAFTF